MSPGAKRLWTAPILVWEHVVQPLSILGRTVGGVIGFVTFVLLPVSGWVGWRWALAGLLAVLLVLTLAALHRAGAQLQANAARLWRQGDALMRRYDDLAVDFNRQSEYDLGSLRSNRAWNEKYQSYAQELGRFEQAAVEAPFPQYDEYDQICREIREVLSIEAPEPRGRAYYLALSRSGVMERLRALVMKEKGTARLGSPPTRSPTA
jgi:hypothetical protein